MLPLQLCPTFFTWQSLVIPRIPPQNHLLLEANPEPTLLPAHASKVSTPSLSGQYCACPLLPRPRTPRQAAQ